MTVTQKKAQIKKHVSDMIDESAKAMKGELLTRLFNSGCLDISSWEPDCNPMILPKAITIALLQHESEQYSARGTSFEKPMKKEVKNIRYFL